MAAGTAPLRVGERTLIDAIAPGGLLVNFDSFAFSHTEHGRVWFIEDFPPSMRHLGMETLYRFPAPIQVVLTAQPIPPQEVHRQLRAELTTIQAAQFHRDRLGQAVDHGAAAMWRDTDAALAEVEVSRSPLFFLSVYVRLMAPSAELLAQWSQELEDTFRLMGLRAHRAMARQEDGLYSTLPVGLNALAHVRNMTPTALAHMFPFSSRQYLERGGLFYGVSRLDRSLVILDDFNRMNANAIVVGKPGSGKSVFLKQKVEQAILQGRRCYVVDIEAEYRPLCEDLGGTYLDLGASRDTVINVLDIDPHDLASADGLLIHSFANFVSWLQVAANGLSAREQNVAGDAYLATLARAGIRQEDPGTWYRPAPLLSDFVATLQTLEHSPAHAQDLAARLYRYVGEAVYAPLFNAPTNVDVANPLVVFGLQDTPDDILTVRLWQIVSFVWMHGLQEKQPTYFIIDEAWHLLQRPEVAANLAAMARRFRKKYGGLILATQHANDLAENPHAVAIRDTAATVVLFAQGSPAIPRLQQLFQLNAAQADDLVRLTPGQALLFTEQCCIPLQVLIPQDRWELFTTRPQELAALRAARLQ